MTTFTRAASIFLWLLVISVGILAFPADTNAQQLATRSGSGDVAQQINQLQTDIERIVGTIAKLTVVTDLTVFIEVLVTKVDGCAAIVRDVARDADIDPSTQANVAIKTTAIIVALTNLSIDLVTGFGVRLAAGHLAKLDNCRANLLSSLNLDANDAPSPVPNMLSASTFSQVTFERLASVPPSIGL